MVVVQPLFLLLAGFFRFEIVLSKTISRKAKTWNCVLNEGKTLDDVRKVAQMVSEVGDADSNPVGQWVTPFTGDMENGRFVLMAGWPNFPAMGKAFGNFLTDGAGDEVMVEWAARHLRCAGSLYCGRTAQRSRSVGRSPRVGFRSLVRGLAETRCY